MFLFEKKFGDRAKAFRTFGVTFIWQFCRNCFFFESMPMLKVYIHFLTKIYRPILFFECGQKMIDLLAEKLRQGGHNFIPHVHKNFRGSHLFGKKISSYHLRSLSGKYFDVCENFLFWSWNPLNFSEKNFFAFENSHYYFWNLNKTLRNFRTKKSPVCQVSILHRKPFSWK